MTRESYISSLKDAARLLLYFAVVLLSGALLAPPLFWGAEALAARGILPGLAAFGFERFFHRALLIAAIGWAFFFFRMLEVRSKQDLGLEKNPRW